MTLIYIPTALLRRGSQTIELSSRVISPGITGSGVMPLMATDGGGLWVMELGDIFLRTAHELQAWRAISGLAGGGVNKLIVPMCDARFQPWPLVDGEQFTSNGSQPHSDDTLFSDGVGYYMPVIIAETVGDADLRATELVIDFDYGGPLVGGEHFSIDHITERHRLYRIVSVEIDDDGNSVVQIVPPLREAVSDGTELDFDQPKCVMQPATPNGMDVTTNVRGMARPTLRLIEAFL